MRVPTSPGIVASDIKEYAQPESPQCVTNSIVLVFGENSHAIPKSFIDDLNKFQTHIDPWSTSIQFDKIYKDIGYNLVHFLHTGEYQTLQSPSRRVGKYRRRVLSYAIALELDLPGLEEHAFRYMGCFDDAVDIYQILAIAQKVWHVIANYNDEGRYLDYLIDKMTVAFEED